MNKLLCVRDNLTGLCHMVAFPLPPDPCSLEERNAHEIVLVGTPADDLWLGNQLINPSVGKLRPPGPEENAGRRDLFQIVQQTTNSYPSDAGSTTLTDSWIGNRCSGLPCSPASFTFFVLAAKQQPWGQ